MQCLEMPELPIRDLEWYKSRYISQKDDIAILREKVEELEIQNKSFIKHDEMLQIQLDASKDLTDALWNILDTYTPNGMNRISHD